jgi:hypothetical protein
VNEARINDTTGIVVDPAAFIYTRVATRDALLGLVSHLWSYPSVLSVQESSGGIIVTSAIRLQQ